MSAVQVALPDKLIDLFDGTADVRAAHGGRGSGKTRSFAKMAAIVGFQHGMAGTIGIILCARQFMNSLEDSSLEEVKRAIEDEPWLLAYYEIGDKYIKSKDGRIGFTFAGLDRNIASIKSKGRLLLCWVDEAEPVTDEAWNTLIPTLREEGEGWNAELWVTWNPKRKDAPVEKRFRYTHDPNTKCAEINWRDNPKFPEKLERDRLRIRNKINERVNDIAVFGDQVRLGADMVVNNERLLAGENQRFAAGESSLFLVNAREVPLIDARIRQVDLEARLRKAFFSLDHEAGTLWRAWRSTR